MKKSTIAIILISLAIIIVGIWAIYSNKTYLLKGATTHDPYEAIIWGGYCTQNFPEIEPSSCTDAIVNCQEKTGVNLIEFTKDTRSEICMILELDLYCENVIETENPEENDICQDAVGQCMARYNLDDLSDLSLEIRDIRNFYDCVITPISEHRESNEYCKTHIYPNQENIHPNLLDQCRIRYRACEEALKNDNSNNNAFDSCMQCVHKFVEYITPNEEQLNQCTRAYESCIDDRQAGETNRECLLRRFPEIQDEDRFGENLNAANACRELLGSSANDNSLLEACIAGHNLCTANQEVDADQNMCTLCISSGLLHNIPPNESDATLCNQASLLCKAELGEEHTNQEMETCMVHQMNTLEPQLYPERFTELARSYCERAYIASNDEQTICQNVYTKCRGPEGDFYGDDMIECIEEKVQAEQAQNLLESMADDYCESILAPYREEKEFDELKRICVESYLQN